MEQNYRFQLLAPRTEVKFGQAELNTRRYSERLAEVERLRGEVYLECGVVQPVELAEHGSFPMRGDDQSWHFLLIDGEDQLVGCARYYAYPKNASFEELRIFDSCVSDDNSNRRSTLRRRFEPDLEAARRDALSWVELGGWALSKAWRGTRAALEMLLGCYALGALWGGSLFLCIATVQDGTSSVLRRIGGSGFGVERDLRHAYVNSKYNRPIEFLKLDSRSPDVRFVPLVSQIVSQLSSTSILQTQATPEDMPWLGGRAIGTSTGV